MYSKITRILISVGIILFVGLITGLTLASAQDVLQKAQSAAAVGTAFSYQGRLDQSGVPANGYFDFTFELFDSATSGSQVGNTITQTVPVTNGIFTTALDFGGNAFDGSARYLEIAVQSGGGGYTTLSPRQALNPVPYAIYADKVRPVENVVIVAKSGGDFTTINEALAAITGTANDPYLVRVGPGVYSETVDLESYVDIEGSGEGVTIIRASGHNSISPFSGPDSATVRASGAVIAELRFLTVESDGSGKSYATAIRTTGAGNDLVFSHVTASASGGTSENTGIYNKSSSPLLVHVTASGSGGGTTTNTGVLNVFSSPTLRYVTASGTGGNTANGVINSSSTSPLLTHVFATASGATTNFGIWNNAASLQLHDVTATASGGTFNYGLSNNSSTNTVVRESVITGSTSSLDNDGTSSAKLHSSKLVGIPDPGNTCFDSINGSSQALDTDCQLIPSGAVAYQDVYDPCGHINGTYLQNREDILGFKFGRIFSLFPGGGISVMFMPNYAANSYIETESDQQGTWTCSGNTITARTLNFYRFDDVGAGDHFFDVDRIDITAVFNSGVISGTRHICAWAIPVDPALVQTSGCTSGGDLTATFEVTHTFTATRITIP